MKSRRHKYSLEQIQDALAKALQELTGKPYDVEIRSLNRHPEHEHSSALFDAIDMTLRVKKRPRAIAVLTVGNPGY